MSEPREVRRRGRLAVPIRLPATFQAGSSLGAGVVIDVSTDGLFIQSALLLQAGERIEVALQTPDGEIRVEGLVRWNAYANGCAPTDSDSGFGIRLSRYGTDYSAFVGSLRQRSPESG